MKIVQVLATSGGVGGLEQHTFNLVNELALNHEVHVIAHPCYVDKFSQQVHFHAIDFARSRWNIFYFGNLKILFSRSNPLLFMHKQEKRLS